MKTRIQFLALGAAVLAMGACSDDEEQVVPSEYITVSTEIGGVTRVSTDSNGNQSFTDGDKISVYAWTGDKDKAPVVDERIVDNSVNTLTAGEWVAAPQMLWKDMKTPHYFIGVYPAVGSDGLDDDLTKFAYTLKSDNEATSDLLVAVNTTGKTASDENPVVPLQFTHVMAKLVINLSFRNQWGTDESGENVKPEVTSVKVCGAVETATVNLLTKEVFPAETDGKEITISEVEKNTRYSSIFIPQDGVRQVNIAIDGKAFIFNNAADIKFEPGKITTINLIVGRNKIELDEVTIAPWGESTTIDGGEAMD